MRKSLVSIVALGLFAGAPVMAQTTTDEATTNQTQPAAADRSSRDPAAGHAQ
jgi:hypothetical protein